MFIDDDPGADREGVQHPPPFNARAE